MKPIRYSTHATKAVEMAFSPDGVGRSVAIDDFQVLGKHTKAEGRTEMRVGYSYTHLFVDVVCHEPSGVFMNSNEERSDDVWNGNDLLEIFFGQITPMPWQFQFAVNAAGQRFDSRGSMDEWQAESVFEDGSWKVSLAFPLDMFPVNGLSIGFNLCRYAMHRHEISEWAGIDVSFHEFENFGELLFCTYAQALQEKTGKPSMNALTRTEYERALYKASIYACEVTHKPICSQPSENGAVISFGTAGTCAAYLYYRRKGEKARSWNKLPIDCVNGVLSQCSTFHRAVLTRLQSGTEYEYMPVTVEPLAEKLRYGKKYSFTTLDYGRNEFSFVFISDIHSTYSNLDAILKSEAVAKCDFIANVGDPLSRGNGYDTVCRGLFDPLADAGKNVVFVRGNHEQVGIYARISCDMIAHPSGKSYFTFRHGGVLFISLDAGNDHDDTVLRKNKSMVADEIRWIRRLVKTDEFKSATRRIVLLHIPPNNMNDYSSKVSAELLAELDAYGIDCAICGHLHKYFVIEAGTGICDYREKGIKENNAAKLSFPVIGNDQDTYIDASITPQQMIFTVRKANGKLVDTVKI